ncbi:MAG: RNA 2',3'-cyclic phosphodiesterase [Acidimicrobiales bacterium]
MRLFVAVALPDRIAELVAALPRPDRPRVRWTRPPQWHVTLRFLGDAPPDDVMTALRLALESDGPRSEPTATLGPATGWFPGRRILQVPVAGLGELAELVRRATASWGPEDEPPYSGHLTVARTTGRSRGPIGLAGTPLSARFAVDELGLYSSRTSSQGAVYARVAAFQLVTAGRHPAGSEG